MKLDRAKLKNEWFGSRMSDETKLEYLFDLIEAGNPTPDRPPIEDGKVRLVIAFGVDTETFEFQQCKDGTWMIELDMTEPDQLGRILEESPGVMAAYVETPHWPVYRFAAKELFTLVAVLRSWSVVG